MQYNDFNSQGSLGGEFTQKFIFPCMPVGFMQKMMAKSILKMSENENKVQPEVN